jgi:hypothetical protein
MVGDRMMYFISVATIRNLSEVLLNDINTKGIYERRKVGKG